MRETDSIKVLWGERVWVPNKSKGLGHVHSRASVSPGKVTSAWMAPAKQTLPLPRSVVITSCFSYSSPTAALDTADAASSQSARIAGARAPLPPMCPCARAQLQAPPPGRPLVARGVGTATCCACSLSGYGQERRQVGPTVRGLCFATHEKGRRAAISDRVECSHPSIGAPLVPGSEPLRLRSLPAYSCLVLSDTLNPVSAHAGGDVQVSGSALKFEKATKFRNPWGSSSL